MAAVDEDTVRIWFDGDPGAKLQIKDWGLLLGKSSLADTSALFTPNTDVLIRGRLNFGTEPLDDLVDWQVGFVQFVTDNGCTLRYSGRKPDEGSVICRVRPFAPLLDCFDNGKTVHATPPWYINDPAGLFKGRPGSANLVNIEMRDFPLLNAPCLMMNDVKHLNNYLYDAVGSLEFWTNLVVISPKQERRFLGYLHWRVRHKASFVWRSGRPVVSADWSAFEVLSSGPSGFLKGPPDEPRLQSLIRNPVGPLANVATQERYRDAIRGSGAELGSRSVSGDGLSPIVIDFWG